MRVRVNFSEVFQEAARDVLRKCATSEFFSESPECEYAMKYTVPSEIALRLYADTGNAGPLWDHREDVRRARALRLGPRQALLMALADAIIMEASDDVED